MLRKCLMVSIMVLGTMASSGQGFQSFVQYVSNLPPEQRQAKTDSFMAANPVLPYFDNDTTAVFIYQGTAQSVKIAGDFTGWSPSVSMSRISPTNFSYHAAKFEKDARLDYKFVTDGNWILDPKNPYRCLGGYGDNSELRMPSYVSPPELVFNPAIEHGWLRDTIITSINLMNTREVRVYLPPYFHSTTQEYGLVLFHDGRDYMDYCAAVNILDNLIISRQIVPLVAVFVPPVNREAEYAGSQKEAYCRFINEEVMPWVESNFRVSRSPQRRATIGASNGGNIALYLGVNHPDQFGKIAAQSSNVEPVISTAVANGPLQNLEFYLDIGTYDIDELIPLVRNFTQILSDKGYPYRDYTWHEGHSWGNWKGHLPVALRQFFPFSTGLNEPRVFPRPLLYQNVPNPVPGNTTIPFLVQDGSAAELILLDLTGRKLMTLYRGTPVNGKGHVSFCNPGFPPGTYYYCLSSNGHRLIKSMNIIH